MNYYNEFNKKTAAWLRELIKLQLIPNGVVDERSIINVRPDELREYTQCHFFAGIGGWSYALQLAGWPEDEPVWTGSCPCQPFSCAGLQEAQSDSRHLWPNFFELIKECRPVHVFGEQVASAIGHGWLDDLSADLEAEDYACGAAVLGAHSVQAPHQRQRLYWVANSVRSVGQGTSGWKDRGMGRKQQPFPWDRNWEHALREFRAVDDGFSYGVEGCNGPRNAIVPQVAAEFIQAFLES